MKNSENKGEKMRSYSTVNTGTSAQEMYETASRDAGRRARELRRLGYPTGYQSGVSGRK